MTATSSRIALGIRNVLIATDFSSCSERAFLHAVAAAHHFGSTLHVVHVVQPTVYNMQPGEGYMSGPVAENMAVDLARRDVNRLVADILHRTNCDDLDSTVTVRVGLLGETLCSMIKCGHIDLAVVGTHGRTGLRRLFLGSTAEYIFRNATCPVLTVGPHSWRSDPQSVQLKHLLFPTDLSADSARALLLVMGIAKEFNARLTVVTVVERLSAEAAHDRPRVVSSLKEKMEQMISPFGSQTPVAYRVEFGDVADSIVALANEARPDLVAFGLKAPDSYVDRLPWMHAYKLVCELDCPVLSLRGLSARS